MYWFLHGIPQLLLLLMFYNTLTNCVKVSHSTLSVSLVHVGKARERSVISQLFASSMNRKRKTSRISSFLQRRHQITLHGTISERLPLVNQYIPKKRISTFYGVISIGEHKRNTFRMMFDTGSCEIWVPDSLCMSTACLERRRFQRPETADALSTYRNVIDVNYLSGMLHAYQAQETVSLDPSIIVKNQTVDFATLLDIPLLQDIQWDGILGLGFRNEDQKRRGTLPFIESIRQQRILTHQGFRNQFAYYISTSEGSLTFGGADLSLTRNGKADFVWVSVDPSTSYWGVIVDKVTAYTPSYELSKDDHASSILYRRSSLPYEKETSIFDTGTYLIYAPRGSFSEKLSQMQHLIEDSLSCEEVKQQLPWLNFTFRGVQNRQVTLTLTPSDYVLNGQDLQCYMGIVEDDAEPDDQLGGWTFGHIFLKAYYTIFDVDIPAIGFTLPQLKKAFSNGTP